MNLLETVQKRAAWWACDSHWDPTTCSWTISHDTSYQQLHLHTLCARVALAYLVCQSCTCIPCVPGVIIYQSVLLGYGSIPFSNYCACNTMLMRSHSLSLVSPLSTINAKHYSYFVHVCFLSGIRFPLTS